MKFSVILVCLLALLSCQSNKDQFSLDGEIEGMNNKKVYLIQSANGRKEKVVVDSTVIRNNLFRFERKLERTTAFTLKVEGIKDKFMFVAENKAMSIEIGEDINFASVRGSEMHQKYMDVYREVKEKYEYKRDLYKFMGFGMKPFSKLAKENVKLKEIYRAKGQELLKEQNQKTEEKTNFSRRNVQKYLDSEFSAFLTFRFLSHLDYKELEKIVSEMTFDKTNSFFVEEINQMIRNKKHHEKRTKAIEVGSPYSDFTIKDVNGKDVKLSDYVGEGKYVLLEFWASWCGPCRHESPNILKAYKKYHDKGFEVFAVSLDDNKKKWLKAIEHDDIPWLQTSSLKARNCPSVELYAVNGIPDNFLIGPDGKILAQKLIGENLHEKLEKIFK